MKVEELLSKMRAVFTPEQVEVLAEFIKFLDQLVKATDFMEVKEAIDRLEKSIESLKDVVRELAQNQRKVDESILELTEAQKKTEQKIAELSEAQKRTEQKLAELSEAQKKTEQKVAELAEAQRRTKEELKEYKKITEQRFAELAEAQKKTEEELREYKKITEQKFAELAEAQRRTEEELREYKKITEQKFAELAEESKKTQIILQEVLLSQRDLNRKLGGIDQTMGYMLENEAYRNLPGYLERNFGIKVYNRMIRREIKGKEINLLAEGQRNGERVLIVGEAKSRLSIGPERAKEVFEELEEKIRIALEEYREYSPEKVVPVIITHFASKSFLEEANKQGYIVVQSFEW